MATARLLMEADVSGENMLIVDSKGILSSTRPDMEKLLSTNPWKAVLARRTNPGNMEGNSEDAVKGGEILIALSVPKPGTVKKELIRKKAEDPVVFDLANPLPEIWPEDAKAGGARIVATSRSDFPNQVNNSLAFPSVFRGLLTVRVRAITNEFCIEGARPLARYAENRGLSENNILPTMDDYMAHVEPAQSIAKRAVELNLARRKFSSGELYDAIHSIIAYQRVLIRSLIKTGLASDYQSNTPMGPEDC